jgi:hypothetical protein
MNEEACPIDVDENPPPQQKGKNQGGVIADALLPPDITISNPSLLGAGTCSVDGTSMTAFGGVVPANCVGTMTAVINDSNGVQVAQGAPVAPTAPANWAFQFAGMPTGNPRPQLTLVVTAKNDSLSRTVRRDFSCGFIPPPNNG